MSWALSVLVVLLGIVVALELVEIPRICALLPEEENVLTLLKDKFGLDEWTGDPCETVTWITCSNNSVESISLGGRNLRGSIPPELSNLQQLKYLTLFANMLTGPIPDLRNLSKLTNLALGENNLTGGIPPFLFELSTLEVLDLSNNPLGGSIPDISGLNNIIFLDLTRTELSGSLPESFGSLKRLERLDVGSNPQLVSSVDVLNNILSLKQFNGSNCGFSGRLPTMQSAAGLELLDLQNNKFNGTIPPQLFSRESLRWLVLSDNPGLSGSIGDTSLLEDLVDFSLNNCGLSGEFPSSRTLKTLVLQSIDLGNNQLTTFPADMRHLRVLQTLDVRNNSITGELPDLPSSSDQSLALNLAQLIFSCNNFHGEFPDSWKELTYLERLLVDSNNLSGSMWKEIDDLRMLKQLNLSYNKFTGDLPEGLSQLQNLEELDVRNNEFTGVVPKGLASIKTLRILRLENNMFSGIPAALLNVSGLHVTYNPDYKILYSTDKKRSKLGAGSIVGIVVGISVITGIIIVVTFLYIRVRTKKKNFNFAGDIPKSTQRFSLKEIKIITKNYKTMIGRGGFGPVYHGELLDGLEVAVKVRAADSKQGSEEFINEVRLLSRLHHRNVVRLIGYGLQGQQQFLVYDYMSQGTLYQHLHHSESSKAQPLDWKTRINIAINAARGIEYLHKDCNPPVIHRDIKTANILLSGKLEAKVADLGISKQAPEVDSEKFKRSGVSTLIKGTFGYLDPEYFTRRKLTTKSDVYSFGVVLLELITGKKPQAYKFEDSNATNLIDWVQEGVSSNRVHSLVDPILRNGYDQESIVTLARMALSCVAYSGSERPDMGEIVKVLMQVSNIEGDTSSSASAHPQETAP